MSIFFQLPSGAYRCGAAARARRATFDKTCDVEGVQALASAGRTACSPAVATVMATSPMNLRSGCRYLSQSGDELAGSRSIDREQRVFSKHPRLLYKLPRQRFVAASRCVHD